MIRHILPYPNPGLRRKATPVGEVTPEVLLVCDSLAETMHGVGGLGLAAPQIGVGLRIIAFKADQGVRVLINPEILGYEGDRRVVQEGCLSFPSVFLPVRRFPGVRVRYRDGAGEIRTLTATEIEAQTIQHEIEHLDGKLLIDHAKQVKREMIERRMKRYRGAMIDYQPVVRAPAQQVPAPTSANPSP